MTPEFASLVNPTFHNVLNLVDRIKQGEAVDLAAERARIKTELEDAELTVQNPKSLVKPEDFRVAKQGLVYWIDEVMTSVDKRWLSMTLEWEYYDENERAWKFYVDGELKARRMSADLSELWYLMLVLGFEGDIENAFDEHMNSPLPPGTTPDKARRQWAVELAKQIRQQKLPDLPGAALDGDVRPLFGAAQFGMAARWAVGFGVAFAVLMVIYLSLPA